MTKHHQWLDPQEDTEELAILRKYGFLHLPRRWWSIAELKFTTSLNFVEIGQKLGISGGYCRQLWLMSLDRGIARIRRYRKELGLPLETGDR